MSCLNSIITPLPMDVSQKLSDYEFLSMVNRKINEIIGKVQAQEITLEQAVKDIEDLKNSINNINNNINSIVFNQLANVLENVLSEMVKTGEINPVIDMTELQNSLIYSVFEDADFCQAVTLKNNNGFRTAYNRGDSKITVTIIGDSISQGANNLPTTTFIQTIYDTLKCYFNNVVMNNYSLGARSTKNFLDPNFIKVESGEIIDQNYTSTWGELGLSWMQNAINTEADIYIIAFGMNEHYGYYVDLSSNVYAGNVVKIQQQLFKNTNSICFISSILPTSNQTYWPYGQDYCTSINRALRTAICGLNANLSDSNRIFETAMRGRKIDGYIDGYFEAYSDIQRFHDIYNIYSFSFNLPSVYPAENQYAQLLFRRNYQINNAFALKFWNDATTGNTVQLVYLYNSLQSSEVLSTLTQQGQSFSLSVRDNMITINGVTVETYYGMNEGQVTLSDSLINSINTPRFYYSRYQETPFHLTEYTTLGRLNPEGSGYTGLGGNGVNHPSPISHANIYSPCISMLLRKGMESVL